MAPVARSVSLGCGSMLPVAAVGGSGRREVESVLRMWSWNVNGLAVWDELDAGLDLALLQEVPAPPGDWPHVVVPDPGDGWATAGWLPGRWSRRTAIIGLSDRVELTPRETTTVGNLDEVAVPVSRPGTLTAAVVHVDGETVTVVSVYGGWERSADPRRVLYADAAAHRLLSDLSSLITGPDNHRLIVVGDLNILHRYGEHGDAYWAGRYASVFDRAEALGLVFVGPRRRTAVRLIRVRPSCLPAPRMCRPTTRAARVRRERPARATSCSRPTASRTA